MVLFRIVDYFNKYLAKQRCYVVWIPLQSILFTFKKVGLIFMMIESDIAIENQKQMIDFIIEHKGYQLSR